MKKYSLVIVLLGSLQALFLYLNSLLWPMWFFLAFIILPPLFAIILTEKLEYHIAWWKIVSLHVLLVAIIWAVGVLTESPICSCSGV